MNTQDASFVPVGARVRPVLMPIGQFDEKVCVAVLGWSKSHGHWARAVSAKPLNSLPNDTGHAIFSFGSLVAADFVEWCTRGQSIELWVPPLAGLIAGDWVEVEGFDFEDAVRVSMSLAALSSARAAAGPRSEKPAVAPRTSDESRFLDAVKTEIQRTRPNLVKGFRRMLSLTGKAVAGEIDFVGHHYVTCYAAVNPKARASDRVQTASAALWRLARARDAFGFASPAAIELTAWIPPPGLPIFTAREYEIADQTIAELKAQAEREQLNVLPVVDVAMACRRLIDLEVDRAPAYS